MKKFILLLLLPLLVYADIDERKVDVYFANGIDTSEKYAEESIYKLKRKTTPTSTP